MGMNIKSLLILTMLGIFIFSSCDAGNNKEVIETIEVNNKKYNRYADTYYFRGTVWGMTKDEVIEIEGREPDSSIGSVIYYDDLSVNGFQTDASFYFDDNKLISGGYKFVFSGLNHVSTMRSYETMRDILTNSYGEPIEVEELWTNENDPDKGKKDYYGRALSEDRLELRNKWLKSDTSVLLAIYKEGVDITVTLSYNDISGVSEKIEKDRKEAEDKQQESIKEQEQIKKNNKF